VKRVSVTLDDDLEVALDGYILAQEAKPSLTAVVQAAVREFLIGKGRLPKNRARHVRLRQTAKFRK
jgi:metal-responsive CopG/Arc/MetJ family transcriptional regulator